MQQHFYVVEDPIGKFSVTRLITKNAVVRGRFVNSEEAHAHAMQLRRDFLSPALDRFGNPLTPAERAHLGVWDRAAYERVLEMSRLMTDNVIETERRPQAVTA
jgi:hypothetical protein